MSDTLDPMQSSYNTAKPDHVEDVKAENMDLERTLPRQVSTGSQRGSQTITGENVVKDPTTNNPVINTSGTTQATIYSDPTTQIDRVQLGKLPDGKYGMWVSDPGVSVKNATDDTLIFNSNQNVFKIVKTVNLSLAAQALNTSGANYATSLPVNDSQRHGLDYTPAITGFLNSSGGTSYVPLPWTVPNAYGSGGFSYIHLWCSVDNESVYAVGQLSGFNVNTTYPAVNIKIYVLQESAN